MHTLCQCITGVAERSRVGQQAPWVRLPDAGMVMAGLPLKPLKVRGREPSHLCKPLKMAKCTAPSPGTASQNDSPGLCTGMTARHPACGQGRDGAAYSTE
jgi:hypothetical protein